MPWSRAICTSAGSRGRASTLLHEKPLSPHRYGGGSMTAPAPPSSGFDPEAEQEVDFARYVRLLGARWWLLVAGLVVGAVIGYLVSLGGTQVYKATATLYLGQPLSASGNTSIQNESTNPSTPGTLARSQQVGQTVASICKVNASEFRKGISTQSVTGALSKN